MNTTSPRDAKPVWWDEAARHLMRRDRILRRLIPEHDGQWLQAAPCAFATLTRIIVSQQVSLRTAGQTWRRLVKACGQQPSPDSIQRLAETRDGLSCLSRRKADYVLGLAQHFADEWDYSAPCWDGQDSEAVIQDLCQIRGVGRWTAEMFLIFSLRRPDILPLDDASLIQAISLHYFSGEPVSRFEAREVAQAWAPWRTVATWFLWRSLDPAAVRYSS